MSAEVSEKDSVASRLDTVDGLYGYCRDCEKSFHDEDLAHQHIRATMPIGRGRSHEICITKR